MRHPASPHTGQPGPTAVAKRIGRKSKLQSNLDRDTDAFYERLNGLLRLYQFRDKSRSCGHLLTVTECYALDEIVLALSLSVTALGEALRLNKSTASRVADSLERKGCISKRSNPEDYKAQVLEPTSFGVALYKQVRHEIWKEHRNILGLFAPEIRQASIRLLEEITAASKIRIGECAKSSKCE